MQPLCRARVVVDASQVRDEAPAGAHQARDGQECMIWWEFNLVWSLVTSKSAATFVTGTVFTKKGILLCLSTFKLRFPPKRWIVNINVWLKVVERVPSLNRFATLLQPPKRPRANKGGGPNYSSSMDRVEGKSTLRKNESGSSASRWDSDLSTDTRPLTLTAVCESTCTRLPTIRIGMIPLTAAFITVMIHIQWFF